MEQSYYRHNTCVIGDSYNKRLALCPNNRNNSSNHEKQNTVADQYKDTKNLVRLYCREILEESLSFKSECESECGCESCANDGNDANQAYADPKQLAWEIEKCIYREFKNTGDKYKNRVRSRVFNLKDVNNPELKAKVLTKEITAEQIATMSYVDMASEEMKKLRARYAHENFIANQLPMPTGIVSDLLKCPRCRKNNCAYNQVQILRADEPMTTFCYCAECGHHWKF